MSILPAPAVYFLATGKPPLYIVTLGTLFSSFSVAALSIEGLGLGLVVGLGSVLVLFFLAFFWFPM